MCLTSVLAAYSDEAYRDALAGRASARVDSCRLLAIHDEVFASGTRVDLDCRVLADVMRLKLARGKWRPRLQDLVESNQPKLVKEVYTRASKLVPSSIDEALDALCELKGVGIATASLLLSSCVFDCAVPFFSDELAAFVTSNAESRGPGKLRYDKIYYRWLRTELNALIDQELERGTDARLVERAIWLAQHRRPATVEEPRDTETRPRKRTRR
ncbi:hypothetical protein PYCC9005_000018 [Savitreella phatthalungensis]